MICFNCEKCTHANVCNKKWNADMLKGSVTEEKFNIICTDYDDDDEQYYDWCTQEQVRMKEFMDAYEEEIYIKERDCGMR